MVHPRSAHRWFSRFQNALGQAAGPCGANVKPTKNNVSHLPLHGTRAIRLYETIHEKSPLSIKRTNRYRIKITKREMTLDHGCKPTIKGHFCSLLISNIICLSSLSAIYPSAGFQSAVKGEPMTVLQRHFTLLAPDLNCVALFKQRSLTLVLITHQIQKISLPHTLAFAFGRYLVFHWPVPPLHLQYNIFSSSFQ